MVMMEIIVVETVKMEKVEIAVVEMVEEELVQLGSRGGYRNGGR
jgi:hypothetical protein